MLFFNHKLEVTKLLILFFDANPGFEPGSEAYETSELTTFLTRSLYFIYSKKNKNNHIFLKYFLKTLRFTELNSDFLRQKQT